MKKHLIFLFVSFLFFAVSCSKKQPYSEDRLVEIYASVELEPIEKSVETIKKYDLDNETKRDDYYNALRELSTDRDKWENFLAKVERYKNTPK